MKCITGYSKHMHYSNDRKKNSLNVSTTIKPLENYLITSFNDIEFKFYLMSANSKYKLKSFLFLSLKPNNLNISENL